MHTSFFSFKKQLRFVFPNSRHAAIFAAVFFAAASARSDTNEPPSSQPLSQQPLSVDLVSPARAATSPAPAPKHAPAPTPRPNASVSPASSASSISSISSADEPVQLENYIVTASPFSRDQAELASATNVLAGQNLLLAQQSSLGATLNGMPGIASTYFSPGASRPVIRGLGGDRVRVLNNGVGVLDASVGSPDHAVAVEPLLARRIEVVRGPATLLYGGNAVGGVVNIIDERIPSSLPAAPVTGRAQARYGTNAEDWTGVAALDGALGNSFAWHVEGLRRETSDTRIPGFANPAEPANEGILANSAISTTAYSGGLSYIGAAGYAGISAKRFETLYGVATDESVTIDLVQNGFDFAGELTRPFGIFSGARAKLGVSDYKHTELEGTEIGTVFKNKGMEGRVELLHEKLFNQLDGAWGVQYVRSDFSALGEEAFLPKSLTQNAALFLFEELPVKPVTLQFGARIEQQKIDSDAPDAAPAGSPQNHRRDTIWSTSLGAIVPLDKNKTWSVSASLARSERAPSAQELYSNGPHIGTGAFEVGNPALDHEITLGFDASLRKKTGRVTGALTAFANKIDGFIYEQATGNIREELNEYIYAQTAAFFYGAELEVIFHLHETKQHALDLIVTADIVRAEDRDTRQPLPRITPARAGIALEYRGPVFSAGAGVQSVDRARELAPLESPTAGYGLLGAHVSWRVKIGRRLECELFARGTNLADKEARNHVSILKDIAPLPGRGVTLGVQVAF